MNNKLVEKYDNGLNEEIVFFNFINNFINDKIKHMKDDKFYFADFLILDDNDNVKMCVELKSRWGLSKYNSLFISKNKLVKYKFNKKNNSRFNKNTKFLLIWKDMDNIDMFYYCLKTDIKHIDYFDEKTLLIDKKYTKYTNKTELINFINFNLIEYHSI